MAHVDPKALAAHRLWLESAGKEGTRLDLRDTYLAAAELRSQNLRHADLRHANLRYADLGQADLRHTDFTNANLANANLAYANLQNAILICTHLYGAVLERAKGILVTGPVAEGFLFYLVRGDSAPTFYAGCRFGDAEGLRELATSHCGAGSGQERECHTAVSGLLALARDKGWAGCEEEALDGSH